MVNAEVPDVIDAREQASDIVLVVEALQNDRQFGVWRVVSAKSIIPLMTDLPYLRDI